MAFPPHQWLQLAYDTYSPPEEDTGWILGTLAWCATAAGVAGLLIVGIKMSLQLSRGEPGEGGQHFRGVFYVVIACLLATSAGPLVSFFGDLSLGPSAQGG